MTDPVRIPGLLDVTIEPPFVRARVVEDLMDEVIAEFDEFEPIATARREDGLVIECVFETKPFDPAKDEYRPHVIAYVRKSPPIWSSLTGIHVVLAFRRWFWERFDDEQRRAVLHHELTHVEVDEADDQGRVPVSLRHHDVEEFGQTMRRFGPVIPGRSAFIRSYLGWAGEHPAQAAVVADGGHAGEVIAAAGTQDEPEPIGHRIAHEVARRINAGELGPDVTATVTESGIPHAGREVDPETGEIIGGAS